MAAQIALGSEPDPTVASMAERAVAEAILLSLPPEILTEIVMLCGRSPRHPRASPAALLSSCRELYELGQAASTRADFLVAVYGTKRVIEGACARLPLLRRDVLESVFRRVGSASHPVPRYQLQRLFRKCANVSRSDLLLSILVFAEELYPPPSTKTAWTSRGRSAAYPDITLGFHVRFADDELFRDLVFAEPNASGSDEDGKRWAHLIEEGRKAGWEVKGDGPMTALLTLKFKYGMDPSNMTVAGLSRNTAALHGKELVRRGMQIHDPTEHFRSDFGIEGLSLGCSLVKEAIELEDERALRRLISLGASIVGEDDSFFWQVIRFARERPAPMTPDADDESVIVISEDRTVEESAMIQAMRGLGYDDVDFYDEHPDIRYKIADFLIEYYGVDKEVEYFGGHDALEYFAARTQGSEGFLRTMLTLLEESGWLATAVGREALINAMGICLKEDRVPLCKVFDSYASRLAEGSDRNLLVVLLRGDIDAAKELLEQEEKLTSQQIVGRLIVAESKMAVF